MLYRTYLITSLIAIITFSVAQYQGWSISSEKGQHTSANHLHSSGGNYSSGSHRGSYHK